MELTAIRRMFTFSIVATSLSPHLTLDPGSHSRLPASLVRLAPSISRTLFTKTQAPASVDALAMLGTSRSSQIRCPASLPSMSPSSCKVGSCQRYRGSCAPCEPFPPYYAPASASIVNPLLVLLQSSRICLPTMAAAAQLILVRSMLRWLVFFVILGLAGSLRADEPKDTYTRHGHTYCAKHHTPTISVIGYRPFAASGGITFVHHDSPHVLQCWPNSPNRLADDRSFDRTSIHTTRGIITFCPVCDADYRHCYGGNRRLGGADLDQIKSIVMRDRKFHKPIIRIYATSKPRAVAIGGHQGRVGDVFTYVVLDKRASGWTVVYPASSHRIVATGRDDL